jgi:hypothetical protein
MSTQATKRSTEQAKRLGKAAAKAKQAGADDLVAGIITAANKQATALQLLYDRATAGRFVRAFNKAYGAF